MNKKPIIIFLFLCITPFIFINFHLLNSYSLVLIIILYFIPAISSIIVRSLFYEDGFKNFGICALRWDDILQFWAYALIIGLVSLIIMTLIKAVKWDFSGLTYYSKISKMITSENNLFTNEKSIQGAFIIYFLLGITFFNIFPGLIFGLGLDLGFRAFLFPLIYRKQPFLSFILCGFLYFLWKLSIENEFAGSINLYFVLTITIKFLSSILFFIIATLVYLKTKNAILSALFYTSYYNVFRATNYFYEKIDGLKFEISIFLTLLIINMILYFKKEYKIFQVSELLT